MRHTWMGKEGIKGKTNVFLQLSLQMLRTHKIIAEIYPQ